MKNIAVILAGGTGSRMGGDLPKQFLTIKGRCVIEHTVEVFQQHPLVDEICIVVHPDWIGHMRYIASERQWSKLAHIVEGGTERYHSSLNAIRAYEAEDGESLLMLHDAARPAVNSDIIHRVVEALRQHDAVGVGIPSTDTLWEASDGNICNIPERSRFWHAQTPQAFRLRTIREAYRRAMQDPQLRTTDDCGVVSRYMPETPIAIVMGDERNIKITYPTDLDTIQL